jgi:hypothetical protein
MATTKHELTKSMQQYGKTTLNEKDQICILYWVLEDAKNKLHQDNTISKLITHYQARFKDENNLQNAIYWVNLFIIELEAKDKDKTTITYLKQHGLYRMLYRNSKLMGKELPHDDALHQLLRSGYVGVAVSSAAILFFLATALLFAAPFWLTAIATGLFVGASAYLSGILYGVINDLFATQANLAYFLLGHQPQQSSLLRTNNKVAQGIAWGVAATFDSVVIAAVVFAAAATITAFFVPMATFLLPIMMIGMVLIAVGAEIYARKKAQQYLLKEDEDLHIGSNDYQWEGLDYMSPTKEERAAWLANGDRNMFGFTKVPIIGVVVLVALIVLSAVSIFLPPLLFIAPLIAVVLPAAFAAVACLTLAIAGAYMYINRNKQVDDRYRLEFERDKIEPGIYIDEDLEYIEELKKTYTQRNPTGDSKPRANPAIYQPIFSHTIPAQRNSVTYHQDEPKMKQLTHP